MFDSILNNERLEIVEVRSILRSGARCTRAGFFLARDLKKNVLKQLRRLKGKKRGVGVVGFGCFFSSLFQVDSGKETSFELVPTLGGASIGPSILDSNDPDVQNKKENQE
jgi:hypothetical protein